MKHFLLMYDYVPDYIDRRVPHRPAHIAGAQAAQDRGELVLAGACIDEGGPIGVLLFKTADRKPVEDFAKADPYVVHGVVSTWRVREWTTVVGEGATAPAARQ